MLSCSSLLSSALACPEQASMLGIGQQVKGGGGFHPSLNLTSSLASGHPHQYEQLAGQQSVESMDKIIKFYFNKSQFEYMTDCFAMFSSPPLNPSPIRSSVVSNSRKIKPS